VASGQNLAAYTRPADVVAAAGDWLGTALASYGFVWMPRPKRLQRQVGTLVHQLHLQPKHWNRQGQTIEVSTVLNVREPALSAWRKANAHRVRQPADDFVCGHLLGYASGRANGFLYGDAEDGDIDLTDAAQRKRRLEAFTGMVREAVLPWFDEASEPELIVTSRAGDYTNDPVALVEWLASRDRFDLVDQYVRRHLSREPATLSAFEEGAAKARAGVPYAEIPYGNRAVDLGWSATAHMGPHH
jgi:hypothetical protein